MNRSYERLAAARPAQKDVKVQTLAPENIEDAVRIHIRSIGYSINAVLGQKHLMEIYAAILRSHAAAGFVAINEADNVVGAVTGAFDFGRFRKSLVAPGMLIRSAAKLAARPRAWGVLLQSVMDRRPAKPDTAATLTSIAVDENLRGAGVGRMLVQSLEEAFASRGVSEYWLETRKDNTVAQSFYLKLGFKEYSRGSRDLCLTKSVSRS